MISRIERVLATCCVMLLAGCREEAKDMQFELLESNRTGLHFSNELTPTARLNMFKYMYFYNGAGAAAGDFNNDGKVDLFFASNQAQNTLYLNDGDLHFRDITKEARIPADSGWSTGVSVVDINNDGLLDLYVCRVDQFEGLKGANQLLVCDGIKDGIPTYTERSAEYGLSFSGFSTQAAFLDYDLDGDLDMFLMNHSVHHNGTFGKRERFMGTYHPLSGDRFFRNDNGHYTDITKETGINSSVIGYGLGIVISDINMDGYPDIFIGNDFHENDYLYINQRNGTFRDEMQERTMHSSQFSMGVDAGDINNDGLPELVSMDMLPDDPYILRRSLGEDEYNLFKMKISYGYGYQYARNNFQLNRGNAMFSEVGLYAGIYASDWSWAPLWLDFDNDGWKDLFISNGIPRRLNDMDYVNYITNDELQQKIREARVTKEDMTAIDKFPQIKLPNRFFRNDRNAQFKDLAASVGNDQNTFSNGAVYADLDNDGDLDLVVNNISDPVVVYRNNANDKDSATYLDIRLKGPEKNINASGATVFLYSGSEVRTYEKTSVHGFQSSMEIPLHIGLRNTSVDSLILLWPDQCVQKINYSPTQKQITVQYSPGLPKVDKSRLLPVQHEVADFENVTAQTGLQYLHKENNFVEFNREPLVPRMLSTEGPALAIADINGDKLDDVFAGSARGSRSQVFLQQRGGRFVNLPQPALAADSNYEDVDASWTDVNGDGFPDLLVASGGNEYYGHDSMMLPRLYLNDGKGKLTRKEDAFSNVYLTGSCILPYDFNGDGHVDLFVGARDVPYEYGQIPESYFLVNDGKGKFTTEKSIDGKIGLVRDGEWIDIDNDGDKDLVLALEWDGICAMVNQQGRFTKTMLTDKKGWWNFVLPVDVNGDGKMDLVAGNMGLNCRLKASEDKPVRLYYNDFDGNGKKEQLVTYYIHGEELPFANKMELEKQIPLLKKKFLYAGDFAKANPEQIFGKEKLSASEIRTANYFLNSVLINKGGNKFELQALPWQAQLTPYMHATATDINEDGYPDLILAGNFYENNVQMGRNDADMGTVLVNNGKGNFTYAPASSLCLKGQVRKVFPIGIDGMKNTLCMIRNSDSLVVVRFSRTGSTR